MRSQVKADEPDCSDHLEALQRQVPVVGGKALIYFALAELLEKAWTETKSSAVFPARELVTGLLEVRSIPHQRLVHNPYLFAIGTTLELATLPEDAKVSKLASILIALCHA